MVKIDLQFFGGRGSGSYSAVFKDSSGGSSSNTTEDLPARMNRMYNGNQMSQEHTVQTFKDAHLTSSTEHLIVYDDDGAVSAYRHGDSGSVSVGGIDLRGKTTLHNHPDDGWSHFSGGDLKTWADPYGEKRMVVTSRKADYTITKTAKFDSSGFLKAMQNAKTKHTDYDKAVDTFLKQNAKKYGYTYTSKSNS